MLAQPDPVTTAVAAFLGLFSVIAFMSARPPEERGFLLPLGVSAFTLKAVLVPIYYIALVKAGLEGYAFSDAYEYHLDGIEIARELAGQATITSRAWVSVDPGFPVVTGIFYWIFGPNTLVVRMFNCMCSTFMLLYIYRLARLYFQEDERVAKVACFLVAFLPYSLIISINHRKESLVTLLATFIFYHTSKLIRFEKGWGSSAFLAVTGLLTIYFFRSGFVLPFIGILFLCYVVSTQSIARSIALAVPTVLTLVVIQFLFSEEVASSLSMSSERIQGKILNSADLAEVGGLARVARMTAVYQIYKLPLATFLVLILPYPPFFSGLLPSVLLSWANLFNLAFLPHIFTGGLRVIRDPEWRKSIPILFFPLIFLILIGATHVGVVRYRETVFPVVLVLAAAGWRQGASLLTKTLVYGGLGALGTVVYIARFS